MTTKRHSGAVRFSTSGGMDESGMRTRPSPAPPWSTLPWHLLVLMEEAVGRNWAAFSQTEAIRRGVEWLDLVRSQPLNARFAALTESFEREGYRPETLRPIVSV